MTVQNITNNSSNVLVSEASPPQSFNQKALQCFKDASAYFSVGVLSRLIFYKGINKPGIDICLSMPESVYHYAENVCRAREYLLTAPALETMTLIAPIVEETMFRFGLQEMLLKKLPKAIIQRVAPSQDWIVDCKATKVARVLVSSTAFALAHSMHPAYGSNCSLAQLIQTFAIGIITGTIQETTGSTLSAMALHSGHNVCPGYLIDALGWSAQCVPAIPNLTQ